MIRTLLSVGLLFGLVCIVRACAPVKTPPPLPLCAVATVEAFETTAGVFYVMDQPNMDKLVARLDGLKNGTCAAAPSPTVVPGTAAGS